VRAGASAYEVMTGALLLLLMMDLLAR